MPSDGPALRPAPAGRQNASPESADAIRTPHVAARRSLVLAACIMATFMAAVESTIVATAMPTIVAELGGFNLFSWVFAVYLLTQAVSIPVYGRLADIYGRKKVFYAGAGLFLIGSTLCGFAPNMVWLVLFRALQGFGAGGVQPIAMTICGDIYTPSERARVQGLDLLGVRRRRGDRPVARRVPGRACRVAHGVLGEPAGRGSGAADDLAVPARTHRAARAPGGLSRFAADDAGDRRIDAGAGARRQPAVRHRMVRRGSGFARVGGADRARSAHARSRCCRWSCGATG